LARPQSIVQLDIGLRGIQGELLGIWKTGASGQIFVIGRQALYPEQGLHLDAQIGIQVSVDQFADISVQAIPVFL
jgi:hypothetical protein